MVQHVSNLIRGSSSGTSLLNYTSPSSKEKVTERKMCTWIFSTTFV